MKLFRIAIIVMRIGLGCLFVYGGVQKFTSKPPKAETGEVIELPDHVVKMKAYIGGLKQTGYFWPMLGVVELVGGLMLLSQVLSLLGAVILMPITLNIFLFHLFLEPHEIGELIMTTVYLLINLAIIAWYYPRLKPLFLNFKSIF